LFVDLRIGVSLFHSVGAKVNEHNNSILLVKQENCYKHRRKGGKKKKRYTLSGIVLLLKN
jgi:ribosomal protein S6E (S10)